MSEGRQGRERHVPAHVRERQRAVAEREAARLAVPEVRGNKRLAHADRSKSAVASTPFGVLKKRSTAADNQLPDEWCGPFSLARKMIEERDRARRLQKLDDEDADPHPLDGPMEELDRENKRKIHPSMTWKSQPRDEILVSGYAKRAKRKHLAQNKEIPSLFQKCLDFVVENFDCVESLGVLDHDIRTKIADTLISKKLRLDETDFITIAEPGVDALELKDCTGISEEILCERLKVLVSNNLEYLVLDQCGRCFGPSVSRVLSNSTNLKALSVGGAYLLSDTDAESLIRSLKNSLTSVQFKACPLVGNKFCEALSKVSLVELALEDITLNQESFRALTQNASTLSSLRSLSLRRMNVTDDIVGGFLHAENSLENLDLEGNPDLSDLTLSLVRERGSKLRHLSLSGGRQFTSSGLEALFLFSPDISPPPSLLSLRLANCDHEAVTDEVIRLVCQQLDVEEIGLNNLQPSSCDLSVLDIQGSSSLTDVALEYLSRACKNQLRELNVSFCPQISNQGLGYLVDCVGNQLADIKIWGCAQINEDFLDGHSRVKDSALKIVGAWVKGKASSTTMTIP